MYRIEISGDVQHDGIVKPLERAIVRTIKQRGPLLTKQDVHCLAVQLYGVLKGRAKQQAKEEALWK